MMVIFKIVQVILALSILIVIHEFGHYIFAKMFHIRVDKFYLFFDVGGVRLFSTKRNKLLTRLFPRLKDAVTDYGIGWLPLGGYCKISGMVDESMDMKQLKNDPQPYEFRTHPAWQRLLVMFGGVLFNFIFAILVYIGLIAHNGTQYLSNEGNSIIASPLAEEMGFRTGDRILSFDDYVPEDFGMLQVDLARRRPSTATVFRNGDTVVLYIDNSLIGEVLQDRAMFSLAVPFVVDTLLPDSPNLCSGLKRGDRITALDSKEISFIHESRALLASYRDSTVTASIVRDNARLQLPLQVDSTGLLGIYPLIPGIVTKTYSLVEAVPAGIRMACENVGGYVRDLGLVFSPSTEAYKSVGSFIAIGQVFPSMWNWTAFFSILAILSIMLAVMNLIPIPGLDGGHIVITIYEMVTGRKPSDRFLMITQMIGMVLLIMLMFLAFGNDINRLLK